MGTATKDMEQECREHLQPFISRYGDPRSEQKVLKALRSLMASGTELTGELAGWASGLIYLPAHRNRIPYSIPRFLNVEAEQSLGVTMATIRRRVAHIDRIFDV